MRYRTLNVLLSMGLLAIVILPPAWAGGMPRAAFVGPSSVCLSHTHLIYPCVSLSPPAYRPRLNGALSARPPQLPLNAAGQTPGWLAQIGLEEDRHATLPAEDPNADPSQAGAAMNMSVIGPLKFKVYPESGTLSQSRFFLGLDRAW